MGGLILGVNTLNRVFCFFKLFIIGCKGLIQGDLGWDQMQLAMLLGGYNDVWSQAIIACCGPIPYLCSSPSHDTILKARSA